MTSAPLELKIERAFQDNVIFHYPDGTQIAQLKHAFIPERKNMRGDTVRTEGFYKIKTDLDALHEGFLKWHRDTYGEEFDQFARGPEQEAKKEHYRNDARFKEAFDFIGVNWEQHNSKIYLPWWREVLASQVSHEHLPDGSYRSTFEPMSPFELQLVKRGLELPVKATSTLGILITRPDAQSKEGYVVLGVRTGSGHPNTYHVVPAGYLQASESFMRREATMYDGFVEDELTPESGLRKDDIEEIRPLAVVHDHIISNGGPEYVFLLKSKLTTNHIFQRWQEHEAAKDRHEHAELVFVPAGKDSVNEFISKNYVGVVANRADRKESERYILNPAALALAAYSDMPLSVLKSYCNGREN